MNPMLQYPLWRLHDTLERSATLFPEKKALHVDGIDYTYSRLYQDVLRCAGCFSVAGLERGGRVALYLDNTYANIVSLYATLFCGGVFLTINPQTKTEKLAYILDNSAAEILVSDTHLADCIAPVASRLVNLKSFFYSGSGDAFTGSSDFVCPVKPFFEAVDSALPLSRRDTSIPNDLAALIYTSGSTGNPKGVMMSHQSMLFATQSLSCYLRLDGSHTIINVLPMAFDYGLYQLLMSVACGATLVLERSFAFATKILNLIDQHKITVFPGVPTIYSTIIAMHRRKPLVFPSVQRITNTAAALPAGYNEDLHEIFPNALIYRMYGLTECKRVCYLEPELADKKPRSVGKAIPGTETFILNPDGTPCAPGETGILHVRGPHVMMGYWKEPRLSEGMLKPGKYPGERVLCTHDWFRMDEDGDLYFVGRSDDIIKTRGEKVSPVEVENVLLGIKGVCEAAVIGVEDDLLGQAIKAFVVLDDKSITEQMIKKRCSEQLENFMMPKYIEFRESLPKTESGKITKKGLK